ncbi:hypothetical protein AOQ84DRAFT_380986 [Glonium stellatum]|uniref:Uncharacterized protein n=1 Tax=Glonium stellatum TaxID=574774 RepID=A0A8E2ESG0_9PEZI|nr:hypothetical protein AOQ84DRAFT_380986 [Glonium stellatum]
MSPKGLTSTIVSSFVRASPEVLLLAFDRGTILVSATVYKYLLTSKKKENTKNIGQ